MALRTALARGHWWSGGATAGTLLVPYSAAIEGLSHTLDQSAPFRAALVTACVTSPAFQVIEKKMVMDQMLQQKHPARAPRAGACAGPGRARSALLLGPAREIAAYARRRGALALFDGFAPFFVRELLYITGLVVVNPRVTAALRARDGGGGGSGTAAAVGGAFLVGWSAGLLTAPFQTLSAMMKYDHNRGVSALGHLRGMFLPAAARGELRVVAGLRRLYFGAGIRSIRTGCASVLYFTARSVAGSWCGDDQ
eukprot:g6559.t1